MGTVAVIGGGASGMMAALRAAEAGARVLLFERQARVGRKLMSTGNGRCNLTNAHIAPARYHGGSPAAIAQVLAAFDQAATLAWFRGLCLLTVEEPGGRIYPLSDQAGSVVDVLRLRLEDLGVELHAGEEVRFVHKGFQIGTEQGVYPAEKVIIACGGLAAERLGGTTGGYKLLESLGHSLTPLRPSLVQLKTDPTYVRSLKGVRADAGLSLWQGERLLGQGAGEVQFTEYGLSGPAVFDLSRLAVQNPGCTMRLDLLRDYETEEILSLLERRCAQSPALTTENLLTGLLHNRLGRTLVKYAGLDLITPLSKLKGGALRRLAKALGDFRLPLTGDMGLPNAQVTAGGVPLGEFDPATLESRRAPGLYACGEVLDVDGDCGGFNLQWAWSSGHLAGRSAAQ